MNALGTAAPLHRARGARAAPLLVLAGFVVVFLWDAFAGRTFVMRDSVCDFLPWRRVAALAARDGHLPLWNPWSRFGQPFVANPQSAVFYPPHLSFDLLPVAIAFPVTLALHLWIGAVGITALLGRFRASKAAALLGGVTFAFGTYFVANLEFMSVMDTLAWSPWTILLACRVGDAWSAHRSARRVLPATVLLAAVLALQLVSGQVQVLGYTVVAALVLSVTAALSEGRRGAALATLTAFGAAGLLALGLAAVQLLPTLELAPHSIRAGGVDPGLDIASMAPRHLVTLLLPFAFGRPGADAWWGPTLFEFWLGAIHVGLPALVLVSFAALRPRGAAGPRGAVVAASAGLALAGIAIALGKHAPFYDLVAALPGAGLVRWPAKGLQLTALGLALLAGFGFDALLARREAASGRADRATLALLGAWCVVALLLLLAGRRAFFEWLAGKALPAGAGDASFQLADLRRSVVFLGLGVAALGAASLQSVPRLVGAAAVLAVAFANLHLDARDIHWVGDASLLTLPADARGADARAAQPARVHTLYAQSASALYGARDAAPFRLAATLLSNDTSLPHGVFKAHGGDALQLRRTFDVEQALGVLPPQSADRLADVLAITHRITGPPFRALLAAPAASLPSVIPRPNPLPRAYLVERWQTVADRDAALRRLLSPDFDPRASAIEDPTSGAPPLPPPPATGSAGPAGSVAAVRYDWNRVDVEVETSRPALLVLCDTWFPGWVARVDGVVVPIRRVNQVFRGVPLPSGGRRVEFTYEPASFRRGAIASTVALVAAAVAFSFGRRAYSSRRSE